MKNRKLGSLICLILVLSVFIPVISIAFARKPDRGPLEKIVFIHYRKGYGKPEETPGIGPENEDDEGYYTFLAKGVKWKEERLPIEYVINPTHPDPDVTDFPDEAFIIEAIFLSAEEWDSNTGEGLFHDDSSDPDSVIDYTANWDDTLEEKDDRNEISFGDYPREGVIAVCIVWGRFGGPPSERYIDEFDIMFDIDFTWGYAGDTDEDNLDDLNIMDLQNIATHELGHGLGLGDLYNRKTTEETMYGYSKYGETKKRTLYFGDIAGIQELYGE